MLKVDLNAEEFTGLNTTSSSRSAFIQDWVFEAWSDLASGPLNVFAEEVVHVRTVAALMAVLAPGRGLDPELAEILGLLHDAGRLRPGGKPEDHAERGAAEVSVFLQENQLLPDSAQQIIVNAIRRHSSKGKQQDDYDELLKDADVFQRLLEGEPILSKPSWRKRVAAVVDELRCYAIKAGDHVLILSAKDQSVYDGYFRFLSEVESWLMLRRHHFLDEESVHDFRVFIRQTKALQSFFKPLLRTGRYERGQKLLQKALHTFETAREGTVELRAVEAYAETLDSSQDNDVRREWIAQRSAGLAKDIGTGIGEAEEFTWAEDLQAWHRLMSKATLVKSVSEMPLDSFALKRISRWLRQWIKHYAHLDFENDISIHESRIDGKKIRYAVRALDKIVPREAKALIDALENYQTLSGALHDVAVSKNWFDKEGKAFRGEDKKVTQGFEGTQTDYLNFREQQGRQYREQLSSVHGRLTAEIEAWLKALQ